VISTWPNSVSAIGFVISMYEATPIPICLAAP
jgi:hypothetical protein